MHLPNLSLVLMPLTPTIFQLVSRNSRLPDLIKQKFTTWQDGARPFQMECMRAQVLHQDVLLHAATGSGKTGVAAGPHLLPSSNGKVTLFVSPLLSLHDEQVGFLSR